MPTSVRLPYPVHQRLRAYAEEHGTTASTLIRQWVEQMLAVPDRPISLADAVRALSTLPSSDQQAAWVAGADTSDNGDLPRTGFRPWPGTWRSLVLGKAPGTHRLD